MLDYPSEYIKPVMQYLLYMQSKIETTYKWWELVLSCKGDLMEQM
jgi:hypothetical protein